MVSDFKPIIHKLEGRTIKLFPIADVHIGAKECDLEGFRKFLGTVEKDPDSYICIVGDLISNGLRDSMTNVFDEVLSPSEQITLAADLLEPVADKILGCVSGNHEYRSKRAIDFDPMAAIMAMIRKPELYRENLAFMRVNLANGNTHDSYALLLVHGKTDNKKKQFIMSVEGIDACVSGHVHSGSLLRPQKIVFGRNNKVSFKDVLNVTAPSWLSWGDYAARALHLPQATSCPQCLVLEFVNSNTRRGEISVIW